MADTSPFTQHGSRYAYIKSEFTRGRVVIHPPIHCATSEQIIACVSHDLARTAQEYVAACLKMQSWEPRAAIDAGLSVTRYEHTDDVFNRKGGMWEWFSNAPAPFGGGRMVLDMRTGYEVQYLLQRALYDALFHELGRYRDSKMVENRQHLYRKARYRPRVTFDL